MAHDAPTTGPISMPARFRPFDLSSRLALGALMAVLASCAEGPAAVSGPAQVLLNFLTPATVRSVSVEASGPGISPAVIVNLPVGADSTARGTLTLTAGAGRRFVITAFDSTGVATHRADTTVTLVAGNNTPLSLRVTPLASSLGITVVFGGVRVTVADTTTRGLARGDTTRIVATATRANGTSIPADSLEWGTANPAVVAVSGGLLTGLRPGATTVAVSYRGASAAVAVQVVAIESPAIFVSSEHACALTAGGAAYCWGANVYGHLGDGTSTARPSPTAVTGGFRFISMALGRNTSCGLTLAGVAYCWGSNFNGALGDGAFSDRPTPGAVAGGLRFAQLVDGFAHSCARTAAGAAYCWGDNYDGQVGDGTTTFRRAPVAVSGGLTFTTLSRAYYHTCGLTPSGAAYCWGDNTFGQLGDGTTTPATVSNPSTPVAVRGGLTFTAVATGNGHSCGLGVDGRVHCWGDNAQGQLGDGTTITRAAPVAVTGAPAFVSITAGGEHSCGVTAAGAAYCWGRNFEGQLGDGSTTRRLTPAAVAGGITFSGLASGGPTTCGLTRGGVAYCWGGNTFGQLGDGTTTARLVPTAVVGGLTFAVP